MRKAIWLMLFISGALLIGGCIVRTTPGPVYYAPPPAHHHQQNCQNVCADWGYRQDCSRRCRVYHNGMCAGWENVCDNRRVCMRYETRCY